MNTFNRLALVLSLCLGAPALVAAEHGLPRSTPEAQGVSSTDVLAFIEAAADEIDAMNSFMLLRHGYVLAEGWWSPYAAERPHILYSLTKSFTSTAVGMAIAEGKLSLDDEVLGFFPDQAPAEPGENLAAMRVHDLLRMATGHDTEPDFRASSAPWVETFLAHPVAHRPGTHFLYNTPATHMLSAIVQKVTGVPTQEYLQERLFDPLNIDEPLWLKSPDGATIGGFGLSLRTEDIAKFGQLYLQEGLWDGRQLLPAEWVRAATTLQVANGSDPESDWNQGYGFQFWRSRHDSYRGDGAFGQYAIVIPEQDVVIAITSGVDDMQAVLNLVFATLLPAMRAAPLPEDPQSRQALRDRLGRLSVKPVSGERSSALAQEVSGRPYRFADNELGIESMAFDFGANGQALTVRTAAGEHRVPVQADGWAQGRGGFAFGLERTPGLTQGQQAIAGNGAWPEPERFVVKLCLFETPFYTTLSFDFEGDEVQVRAEPHVGFGPPQVVSLVGRRS